GPTHRVGARRGTSERHGCLRFTAATRQLSGLGVLSAEIQLTFVVASGQSLSFVIPSCYSGERSLRRGIPTLPRNSFSNMILEIHFRHGSFLPTVNLSTAAFETRKLLLLLRDKQRLRCLLPCPVDGLLTRYLRDSICVDHILAHRQCRTKWNLKINETAHQIQLLVSERRRS